jgi:hypothetical protein
MSGQFLRQGSDFELEGVTYCLWQVGEKLKATARGVAANRVWDTREEFERETGRLILPGRAAEIPAYVPKPWDDERLRKAVNYTEADIYTDLADDLKRAALAKLNEIERLMVDAASRAARDEYDRHKAHITGTMARYAAALHNIGTVKKNFTEERVSDALFDFRDYLRLPPGHDRRGRVFHVDPEMTDFEMYEMAGCYPAADKIEAVIQRRPTEHEYIGGSRQLPPKKLAQAVVFYGLALDYQRKVLSRTSAEYEELRSFGPDAVGDETAEKWHGRRDVALDAALQSKLSTIASAKGNIERLAAKIVEVRGAMRGRTVKAKVAVEDEAQASLFF